MDWKELCRKLYWANSIDPAISATENLLEELKQFKQEQLRKIEDAENCIETLAQCLILHQDEKVEEVLGESKPFEDKIKQVIEAFADLDIET